jgi:hypothetical protein
VFIKQTKTIDDDVLLISESAYGLQNALNAFSLYCKQWKLKVSTNKTASQAKKSENSFP